VTSIRRPSVWSFSDRSLAVTLTPRPTLTFSLSARQTTGGERWPASLSEFSVRVRVLTGNRIQILDYELSDLRRRYAARDDDAGAQFWRSVSEDAPNLAGSDLTDLPGAATAAR
jgi:hypothetical protein